MSNLIMSDPIKMRIFGIPASGANPTALMKSWKNDVREAARKKAEEEKGKIKGDCHLYVDFILPDEPAFEQVDIDNLLMSFCAALKSGGMLVGRANILGIKAHKSVAREEKDAGAKAVLIPTHTLSIIDVKPKPGPELHPSWKRGMQQIETNKGVFIDNTSGDLWAFRHEGAVPGFHWEAVKKRDVRGVTAFLHRIKTPWINKWSTHLLAQHMAEGESADLSEAPKHIKFEVDYKQGPATKNSTVAHKEAWRRKVLSKVKKKVDNGEVINGDCLLYVVFSFPSVSTPPSAHDDALIHKLLKIFWDQLKDEKKQGKIVRKGIIMDDARILGVKAHKLTSREGVTPGAYAMFIPTETCVIKKARENIPGSEFYPGWNYKMQRITALGKDGVEGVFMDNMPGYLWGSPYPGFEPGCKWERMEGQKVHGVIVHKKWSETRWINKWDINLLMDGVRKDRQD